MSNARKLASLLETDGDVITAALDNIVQNPTAISDQVNTSTGALGLPSGTTAQRPASPSIGYTRFNTTIGSVEFWDGSAWIATNLIPTINSITGDVNDAYATTLTFSLTNATDTIDVVYKEGVTLLATTLNVSVSSDSFTTTSFLYNCKIFSFISKLFLDLRTIILVVLLKGYTRFTKE